MGQLPLLQTAAPVGKRDALTAIGLLQLVSNSFIATIGSDSFLFLIAPAKNGQQLCSDFSLEFIKVSPRSSIVDGAVDRRFRRLAVFWRRAISPVVHQYGQLRINRQAIAAVVSRGVDAPHWKVIVHS